MLPWSRPTKYSSSTSVCLRAACSKRSSRPKICSTIHPSSPRGKRPQTRCVIRVPPPSGSRRKSPPCSTRIVTPSGLYTVTPFHENLRSGSTSDTVAVSSPVSRPTASLWRHRNPSWSRSLCFVRTVVPLCSWFDGSHSPSKSEMSSQTAAESAHVYTLAITSIMLISAPHSQAASRRQVFRSPATTWCSMATGAERQRGRRIHCATRRTRLSLPVRRNGPRCQARRG